MGVVRAVQAPRQEGTARERRGGMEGERSRRKRETSRYDDHVSPRGQSFPAVHRALRLTPAAGREDSPASTAAAESSSSLHRPRSIIPTYPAGGGLACAVRWTESPSPAGRPERGHNVLGLREGVEAIRGGDARDRCEGLTSYCQLYNLACRAVNVSSIPRPFRIREIAFALPFVFNVHHQLFQVSHSTTSLFILHESSHDDEDPVSRSCTRNFANRGCHSTATRSSWTHSARQVATQRTRIRCAHPVSR